MHQTLYKAKCSITGIWIYGMPLLLHGDDGISRCLICTSSGSQTEAAIDTLCQRTGLKDMHGRDIYEEDILRLNLGKLTKDYIIQWSDKHACYVAKLVGDTNSMQGIMLLSSLNLERATIVKSLHDN